MNSEKLTELEQAKKLVKEAAQFKAEANETLKECRATLVKTQRFNDQAMFNQRKMVFALNSLLPSRIRLDVNFDLEAEEFTNKVEKETAAAIEQREVFDIVHAINVLAMANADVIHIFTRYSAHVNCLFVNVAPMDADYSSVKRKYLYAADVEIDKEDALEQLLSIESKLTELIIEAREEAETNVEVEA
ncbi:hypothetical protein AB4516_00610 [Vibrio sp. 10N.222.54.F12]|uniref:hypothetical protein n=1 Tax=Vibrio TaxID=662 RepID=UPI000CAC289D|nr:hypothetical protein [Vibrio tasmaniensis]PML17647.1 hypothetical protein BCT83_08110 [Vibrio tasmaniensis]